MPRLVHLIENLEQRLFHTETFIVEYVVIEEELTQLFNFCLSFQNSVFSKLENLKKEKLELEANLYDLHTNFDGLEFRNIDIVQVIEDFEIPTWTNTIEFIVPMNQIVLISIFVEKSLKSLCSEYSPENQSKYYGGHHIKLKQKPGKSKIETYINYLKINRGFDIQISSQMLFLDNNIRKMRNSFVHGDWDEIRELSIDFNPNELFVSASCLFEKIEKAYMLKRE